MKTFKELIRTINESSDPYTEALKHVARHPQHQGSTHDQLKVLHQLADHFGLYDAADLVKGHIDRTNKKVTKL